MADLKKQRDAPGFERFWRSAEDAAREVANWPAWKRLEPAPKEGLRLPSAEVLYRILTEYSEGFFAGKYPEDQ